MAVIKVADSVGVRELKCFDTLDDVPYETGFEDGTELLPNFQTEDEQIE